MIAWIQLEGLYHMERDRAYIMAFGDEIILRDHERLVVGCQRLLCDVYV